jgi:hypothetical protein
MVGISGEDSHVVLLSLNNQCCERTQLILKFSMNETQSCVVSIWEDCRIGYRISHTSIYLLAPLHSLCRRLPYARISLSCNCMLEDRS